MALKILNAGPGPDTEELVAALRASIEGALPGAVVEVRSGSPGHFEIAVTSDAFAGKSRVQQQQLVYGAITRFMTGDAPPVHAVDRMECRLP